MLFVAIRLVAETELAGTRREVRARRGFTNRRGNRKFMKTITSKGIDDSTFVYVELIGLVGREAHSLRSWNLDLQKLHCNTYTVSRYNKSVLR